MKAVGISLIKSFIKLCSNFFLNLILLKLFLILNLLAISNFSYLSVFPNKSKVGSCCNFKFNKLSLKNPKYELMIRYLLFFRLGNLYNISDINFFNKFFLEFFFKIFFLNIFLRIGSFF